MNAILLLRDQLKSAHKTQEATMADVTEQSAHFNETNKALPVGAAYAHSVLSEDIVVSTMFAHKTPLSTGNPDTGLSEPLPDQEHWDQTEVWAKKVKVDLTKLREFALKVYQATDDYLASLKDEDLDQEIEMPGMGKHSLAWFFNNFVVLHVANLTGEISAAKGFQGLKGYPF